MSKYGNNITLEGQYNNTDESWLGSFLGRGLWEFNLADTTKYWTQQDTEIDVAYIQLSPFNFRLIAVELRQDDASGNPDATLWWVEIAAENPKTGMFHVLDKGALSVSDYEKRFGEAYEMETRRLRIRMIGRAKRVYPIIRVQEIAKQ